MKLAIDVEVICHGLRQEKEKTTGNEILSVPFNCQTYLELFIYCSHCVLIKSKHLGLLPLCQVPKNAS